MSQKKVDRYKEEKANRAKNMKKQKRIYRLEMGAVTLVLVALVGWFGLSVYQKVSGNGSGNNSNITMLDTSSVQDYLSDLQGEETEAETEAE